MDFLKSQFDRIRLQLNGLSASQKMLTGTLVAIMAITLLYWVKYAGKPEMEALLDQPMAADDITRIRVRLGGMGITSEVTGDRVLVPADQKMAVLTSLSYDGGLPSNTSAAWDAIVKQISPWNSESQNAVWWNQAKQAKLAEVITGWQGVSNASVIIDATERRSFTNPIHASATINIVTKDGKRLDARVIRAAADLVSGAQAGLDRGRITVVVNGISYPMHDEDSDSIAGGSDLIALRQEYEQYFGKKVSEQLRWLQADVFVQVTVDVNNKSTVQTQQIFDPKGIAKVELHTKTKALEENSSQKAPGDPGVGANTQTAGVEVPGESHVNNNNEDETDYQSGLSKSDTTTKETPGKATVVAASVRVPQSYFVKVYKDRNPTAKDPDDATLQPFLDKELMKIRADVKNCLNLTDDKAASVETYSDQIFAAAQSPAAPMQASSVTSMVGGHAKELVLGALAVMSLFMVSSMVKKSSPALMLASGENGGPAVDVPQFPVGEQIVGEAMAGDQALDGMELNEDAAKAQQMLGQVSDLVKENPDAAANLVKRWLNK